MDPADMPKASVIIPAYNCAESLLTAIDSVLGQTYMDFEILVVDDGSTDDTREIIERYARSQGHKVTKSQVRYIYQKNAGPGAARNKGIKEARGEYIAFLDADDVMLKDALFKRAELLDRYPEVGFVFGDYYLNRNNKIAYKKDGVLKCNNFSQYFSDAIELHFEDKIIFNEKFYKKYFGFSYYPIFTGTVMIRKAIINEIGLFKEGVFIGEDLDFWLRIISKYRTGFIDQPLVVYNHYNPASITKNHETFSSGQLKALKEVYNTHKAINTRMLNKKISNLTFDSGYFYFQQYDMKNAKKNFILSIKYNLFQLRSFIYLGLTSIPIALVRCMKNIKLYLNI